MKEVLVSNFALDLVRIPKPKPSLLVLHCLISLDFNLYSEFVMLFILPFLNNFLKFGGLRHGFTRLVSSFAHLNPENSNYCLVINSTTGITLFLQR
jgi:hypothetical protein